MQHSITTVAVKHLAEHPEIVVLGIRVPRKACYPAASICEIPSQFAAETASGASDGNIHVFKASNLLNASTVQT